MRIIIIGKGDGWRNAPREGETWGVNNLCLKRDVKLVFNIHDLDTYRDHPLFDKTIAHVNKNKIPIITQKKYKHIPTSIPFPLDEMPFQYFGNSIDYMVAYAIHKGAIEIDLYGVVMGDEDERTIQRRSLEFWLGYAQGKGIKVTLHHPTHVCSTDRGLYGYDYDDEDRLFVLARPENRPEKRITLPEKGNIARGPEGGE